MTDLQKKIFGAGIAAVMLPLLLVVTFPITLYCAWCDKLLWNWFAAPYLHLQPVTLWLMLALGMIVRLFTTDNRVVKGQEFRYGYGLAASILGQTFTLLIGYGLHRWFVK